MKDTEFIELLNLYLDHEISAADAARLEAEVQANLARRRIYHQYCRMQKACRMAAGDFRTEAEVAADKKVVPFNSAAAVAASARHGRASGLYTLGTFSALAACVAIIFVGRSRQASNTEEQTIAAQPPHVQSAPGPMSAPQAAFVAGDNATPRGLVTVPQRPPAMLVRDPLLLTGTSQAEAVFAAAVEQANNQLAWLESVQVSPLQQREPADLHFAATLKTEGRPLGARQPAPVKNATQESEEMVGFKFMK
jgi:hypothetical protein